MSILPAYVAINLEINSGLLQGYFMYGLTVFACSIISAMEFTFHLFNFLGIFDPLLSPMRIASLFCAYCMIPIACYVTSSGNPIFVGIAVGASITPTFLLFMKETKHDAQRWRSIAALCFLANFGILFELQWIAFIYCSLILYMTYLVFEMRHFYPPLEALKYAGFSLWVKFIFFYLHI